MKLRKEIAGYNHLLNKDFAYYTYVEVIIDRQGTILERLTEPKNVVLLKKMLPQPPQFNAALLSNQLVSVKQENEKWIIKKYKKVELVKKENVQ